MSDHHHHDAGEAHRHSHDETDSRRGIDSVDHLAEHLSEFLSSRSIVLGVGNELCGDDGAGPMIANRIAESGPWQVLDVQSVPESFLMKIVEARPDTVLIIDALDFDAEPGAVELLTADAVTGQGPSTHGPAPIAFLDLLAMMHPCRRVILGIQPANGEFGETMTDAVARGVDFVVEGFVQAGQAASA